MELQTTNKLVNITTSEQIIKELYHVNYLVAYPLSDIMLEGWAKCIIDLKPKTTPEDLRKVINKMKLGVIPFDPKLGIQNIFKGLVWQPTQLQGLI